MTRKVAVRAALLAVVLLAAAPIAAGYASSLQGPQGRDAVVSQGVTDERPENVTVIATDSNTWLGQENDGLRANAELVAVAPNGSTVYYNDTYTRYWDVDPVEGEPMTVEYVAAMHLSPGECGGEHACTRNVIERVDLRTGETTRIFSRITPGKHSTRWHDADRLDENHFVVADIAQDRVFVVNTTTGIVTWSWDAQTNFSTAESGGSYPEDWTHVNDVEALEDGRFMVSLRNQDSVVFVERETGLDGNWTLGTDDAHDTLYEQHNPDFIPAERGGPAVLVADSETNRVVEYQREDGATDEGLVGSFGAAPDGWNQTWEWRDGRLQWPRDADRLPDGDTLVTDSNGNRVLEVDENGDVVWSLEVAFPYEAERIGTGDESAGGPSASEAGLESRTNPGEIDGDVGEAGVFSSLRSAASDALQGPTANAVMYVMPAWMNRLHLVALMVIAGALALWAAVELYWSPYRLSFNKPVSLVRRR